MFKYEDSIPKYMLERLARKLSNLKFLALAGAIQAAPACTLMTETEKWPLEDKPSVTGQDSPDEDYKVPPTTKVLDEEGIAQLETITNEGTLLFPANSPYARSLEKGDVIVGGVSDKTPYGLLRKITEIIRNNKNIRLDTVQASLEEAVEEGSLRTHIDFSEVYLEQTLTWSNVETRNDALRGELHEEGTMEIDFRNTNLAPGIDINGRAQLTVGIDLEIEIKRFTLEHFKLGINGNEKLALEFIAAYERAYEKTLPPVEPFPLKPFTIWAWGIPIIIFPHYSITLGFEAGARIDLSAAIDQEAHAEVALVYKRETGLVPVSDFQNSYGLRYDPDFVGITGKGELFAKHKLLFAPYNIGGVFVSFRGGVGAEVTPDELVVYANLGVGAGAELRSLKHEMEEAGAEGEGEGEGGEIDVTTSIEIPLYSYQKDLLRKRLGGGEPPQQSCDLRSGWTCTGTIRKQYDTCGKVIAVENCAEIPNYTCFNGRCLPVQPNCHDGIKNNRESDVDCGLICSTQCDIGEHCTVAADCVTNYCNLGTCQTPEQPEPEEECNDQEVAEVRCGNERLNSYNACGELTLSDPCPPPEGCDEQAVPARCHREPPPPAEGEVNEGNICGMYRCEGIITALSPECEDRSSIGEGPIGTFFTLRQEGNRISGSDNLFPGLNYQGTYNPATRQTEFRSQALRIAHPEIPCSYELSIRFGGRLTSDSIEGRLVFRFANPQGQQCEFFDVRGCEQTVECSGRNIDPCE